MLINALFAVASATTLVIDFTDGMSTSELLQHEDGVIVQDIHWVSEATMSHGIAVAEVSDLTSGLADFEAMPDVESVEPRMTYTVSGFLTEAPDDPQFGLQWHMDEIDAPWSWKHTKSGEGVIVAVLDTGFTLTKDMDSSRVLSGSSFTGEPITDWHGHGTHCTSTIAEWTNNGIAGAGVTTKSTILPVKVLSDEGFGYNDWIANGIYYAVDQHAQVISMSLGGPSSSSVIKKAVDYAISKGVIVVAAAGNDGCKGCMGYPAKYPGVISVGATGPDHKRSFYSSYGKELVLSGPGGNKQLKNGGVWQQTNSKGKEDFYEWQGTSMATPHVAGVVAVLLSEGVPASGVKDLLTSTARGGASEEVGAGIVNIKDAVQKFRGKSDSIANLPIGAPPMERTTILGFLAMGLVVLMGKSYGFSNKFITESTIWAAVFGGPLAFVNLLPWEWTGAIPGTFHYLDLPDLVFGVGFSGFPLWLSPLLVLPAVFAFTPSRRTRGLAFGMASAAFVYFVADAVLLFNTPWVVTDVAARAWLAFSAIITFALGTVVTEFHKKNGE